MYISFPTLFMLFQRLTKLYLGSGSRILEHGKLFLHVLYFSTSSVVKYTPPLAVYRNITLLILKHDQCVLSGWKISKSRSGTHLIIISCLRMTVKKIARRYLPGGLTYTLMNGKTDQYSSSLENLTFPPCLNLTPCSENLPTNMLILPNIT